MTLHLFVSSDGCEDDGSLTPSNLSEYPSFPGLDAGSKSERGRAIASELATSRAKRDQLLGQTPQRSQFYRKPPEAQEEEK